MVGAFPDRKKNKFTFIFLTEPRLIRISRCFWMHSRLIRTMKALKREIKYAKQESLEGMNVKLMSYCPGCTFLKTNMVASLSAKLTVLVPVI